MLLKNSLLSKTLWQNELEGFGLQLQVRPKRNIEVPKQPYKQPTSLNRKCEARLIKLTRTAAVLMTKKKVL
jgi:hypothetical protein